MHVRGVAAAHRAIEQHLAHAQIDGHACEVGAQRRQRFRRAIEIDGDGTEATQLPRGRLDRLARWRLERKAERGACVAAAQAEHLDLQPVASRAGGDERRGREGEGGE
jgi:hypothetical protein